MSEVEELKKELESVKKQLAKQRKRCQQYEEYVLKAGTIINENGAIAKSILDKYRTYVQGNKETPFTLGLLILIDLNRMEVNGRKGIAISEDTPHVQNSQGSGAGQGPGNLPGWQPELKRSDATYRPEEE